LDLFDTESEDAAMGSLWKFDASTVFQGLFCSVSCFLGPMIWERGLTPVCFVVSTLLPWRSHTLNFCLFVCLTLSHTLLHGLLLIRFFVSGWVTIPFVLVLSDGLFGRFDLAACAAATP
jgi:hypothetical protein